VTRDDLARRQAELVRALVAGEATPAGFDDAAVAATKEALIRKRAGEIGSRDPYLKYELGAEFLDHFRRWAHARPKTSTAADTDAFRAWCIEQGIIEPAQTKQRWWTRLRRNN
jgi:hypothetical protein